MKKLIAFISLSLLSTMQICAMHNYYKEIIIREETIKIKPREVTFIPVQCFYNERSKSLNFNFHNDMGYVMITVQNPYAAEFYIEYADSAEGISSIYISGTKGQYIIKIETQTGILYKGEFDIE